MNDEDSGTSLPQDLLGGLLAVAFGLFAFVTASSYPMGSLLRMGPGFFPCTIAALIMLLGLALIGSGFRSRTNVDIRLRSVLMIGLGIVIFALLLERAGLVPATLALVLVSSAGRPAMAAAASRHSRCRNDGIGLCHFRRSPADRCPSREPVRS